ncbi:MAG TPA: Gfo/Idh/MocA family oxidoreductase [Magnetospirillaceae bacterium]|jgi:D-galactose 1-dehydrogenase
MSKHRVGVIGLGKIAQDQHLPVIAKNPAFELIATSSTRGLKAPGARDAFKHHADLLKLADVDAVAICTPPQVRHRIAREALEAGKHVMLEKPPAATTAELTDLERIAKKKNLVLFTTWHSQYNAAVDDAKAFLTSRTIKSMLVTWKESVRKWHPGQAWIWEAGGFGVFDPGINALSIVTKIMPEPVFITAADLSFPSNCQSPIAANLDLTSGRDDQKLRCEFDWREAAGENWNIAIETHDGKKVNLLKGGTVLEIDGKRVKENKSEEYEGIYERFDGLLTKKQSAVEYEPFQLVADAFMLGKRLTVEAFHE